MPLDTRPETAGPTSPQPPDAAPTFVSNILNNLRQTRLLPFVPLFNPTLGDISPIEGGSQPNPEFYKPLHPGDTSYGPGTYEQPFTGGLARVLTSPLAQNFQPRPRFTNAAMTAVVASSPG